MNSSVKRRRRRARASEIISREYLSVVKNAIYKVIRAHSAEELGQSIVVQGAPS